MIEPAMAPDEGGRLAALRALKVLDTANEERFDRLTRLARQIFGVPIAVISLVDANRQWFKSCLGLTQTQTPRGISFCGHAILGQGVFVIEDATKDPRFAENPLVTDGPRIRFYAGAPLRLKGGHAVGTLCIIGPQARAFGSSERALLSELGALALAELEDVEMAAREHELRDFIESAGAIIHTVDGNGRISMVNRAWTAAFGYSAQEAAGMDLLDLVVQEEQPGVRAFITSLPAFGESVASENSFLANGGRILRLRGSVSALTRPDGSVMKRSVYQDVTAQRELERIRVEITHHVSHELKTPLAVTTLALGMLAETDEALNARQRQLVATAQKGAAQLAQMAADLLDLSRSESGKIGVRAVSADLNAALAEIAEAFGPLIVSAGLSFTAPAANGKLAAEFDEIRLRQILGNLISNAIKFTPKGGVIAMGAQDGPDGFVEVFVRDTGVGMKKEDLSRIFDRLYQTSNKALRGEAGLGLGLHICRELVSAHGGRIRVESEPGKGTTFFFTLRRP